MIRLGFYISKQHFSTLEVILQQSWKLVCVIYFLNVTWENNYLWFTWIFFSELRKDKLKADKKGNLKEVATLANYLGELLAKIGEI